jgi:hypothetical protein
MDEKVEEAFRTCQLSMERLAKRGYQLVPKVNGQWRKGVVGWRIVPMEQNQEYSSDNPTKKRNPSFENLLLALKTVEQ